ncbi:MAG: hypothetical protein ACK56I_31640 [bacterium]
MLWLNHHGSRGRGDRRKRPYSQMRLQAVYADRLLAAAHCQPEVLVPLLQHFVWAHIQRRQGRQRAAAAHIHVACLQKRRRRLGRASA